MRFVLGLLFGLLIPVAALGQTYPNYQEIYVNDFADLLTDEDEDRLRNKLRSLRSNDGIEFTVVTIKTMRDYGHDGDIEPFATGLFNSWGVGNAERNDGIMMLVAKDDRKIRIEVGSGYGQSKNRPMKKIIDDIILPQFKASNFAYGIVLGVDAVIEEVTRPPLTASERVQSWLVAIWNGILAVLKFLFWPLIAGGAGLATWLYRRYLRYKPRICPVDRSKMQLLAEDWDDEHLRQGQLKEEELESVDYDVWVCPSCDHRTIEAYKSWFSRYKACRSCGYKTLEGNSTTLKSATTTSTGLKRVDYDCQNCGEAYSVEEVIPKVSKSSSSSGGSSSFGGGSSSGGGASGSW